TVPAANEHVPVDGVADTKLTPAGSGSLSVTVVAGTVLTFRTVNVYVSDPPENTGSGESVFVSVRSVGGGRKYLTALGVVIALLKCEYCRPVDPVWFSIPRVSFER